VTGVRVTQSFFEVLGVPPALGRGFLPEEDRQGGPRVVVLSHGCGCAGSEESPRCWATRVTLNGEPYTIVGIAPSTFQFPEGCSCGLRCGPT
jgi:hypothetical protein